MNNLTPILITGITFFCIYRIFELFVRRTERKMMIDKMQFDMDPKMLTDRLMLPVFGSKDPSSVWPLRAGLLMAGIGLGLILGFVLETTLMSDSMKPEFANYDWDIRRSVQNTIGIIYLACVAVFGGIGLLTAYFVEQKNIKKTRE